MSVWKGHERTYCYRAETNRTFRTLRRCISRRSRTCCQFPHLFMCQSARDKRQYTLSTISRPFRSFGNILETIQLPLPPSITQNPNLHTSKYSLLSTLEINPKLHNIPILDSKRLTLLPRLTQSDMVQEGPRRAFDIFHPPTRVVP